MSGGGDFPPGRIDPKRIEKARAADIKQLWISLGLPEPDRKGKALSPWRDESEPSVQVGGEKNIIHDYGSGETLDTIALVQKVKGYAFGEAINYIIGRGGEFIQPERKPKPPKPVPILPVPNDAGPAPDKHFEHGRPSARWAYRNEAGELLGYVYRFDKSGGGKEIVPLTYCQHENGTRRWTWRSFDKPRPLYGLDRLAARPAATVLWLEGEKAADAAGRQFPDLVPIASPGGSKAVNHADFSPLAGRTIYVWPDADTSGRKAAREVCCLALKAGAERVLLVSIPDDFPSGWDLADPWPEGWNDERGRELLDQAAPFQPADVEIESSPETSSKDIRAQLWKVSQQPGLTANERHKAIAKAVVEWLHARGSFYFHSERRDFASVLFFDASRKILLPVQSHAFQSWLADALTMNRAERAFFFVQSAVETEGLSPRATPIIPSTYWAASGGSIYLSNGSGAMVRIQPASIELVDNGTDGVLFPFGATLAPWKLTEPKDPFETCSVFREMSTTAAHGHDLLRLWVLSLPSDQRTKPPLVISGVIGSGKTRVMVAVFELYGIPPRIGSVLKTGDGDFWAAVDAGGIAGFDNADTSVDWFPDALAAASTGGTLEKRRLYTDADRVSLKARAWVALTSASPTFASDAGCADRLQVVRLGRRRGETAEAALTNEITANRDSGLSFIAYTLAAALADNGPVPQGLNARHPDFARLAVRIGRAMGREAEAVAALRAAEADKALFNLENDTLGAALLDLLDRTDDGSFVGTAADLLDGLKSVDSTAFEKMTTKRLAKRLSKLWPHLEGAMGAESEKGHGGYIRYLFKLQGGRDGEIGEFQRPFSGKVPTRENYKTLPKNTPSISPNSPEEAQAVFSAPVVESAVEVVADELPF